MKSENVNLGNFEVIKIIFDELLKIYEAEK